MAIPLFNNKVVVVCLNLSNRRTCDRWLKKELHKQISKRKVFTKEVLSLVLQDELREVANKEVNDWFGEQIKEKSKGRNHDLTVAEYKVAQETEHLEQIQEQVHDADIVLTASQIAYREVERRQTKELDEKRSELQSVKRKLASVTDKANEAAELLDKINVLYHHSDYLHRQ